MTYMFKLLRGVHSQSDKTYLPGDVFESGNDIRLSMNLPGFPPRVELQVSNNSPVEPAKEPVEPAKEVAEPPTPKVVYEDGLESLDLDQLRNMAAELNINLGNAKKKSVILDKIRTAPAQEVED